MENKKKMKIKLFTIFCFTLSIIFFGYGFITLMLEEYKLFQMGANLMAYLSASLLLVLFGEIARNDKENK